MELVITQEKNVRKEMSKNVEAKLNDSSSLNPSDLNFIKYLNHGIKQSENKITELENERDKVLKEISKRQEKMLQLRDKKLRN